MGRIVQLLLVVLVALFFPSASTLAGELPVESYDVFSQFICLPGLGGILYTKNSGDSAYADMELILEDHDFTHAEWWIEVPEYDTSKWSAVLSAYGFLLEGRERPTGIYRRQRDTFNRAGVEFSDSLYVGYKENTIYFGGGFNLSPALITEANFQYNEYEYLWDWLEPARTRWEVEYRVEGQFLAASPEEARALGAQFVNSVPEPSTICLLGSFLLCSIFASIRYWRRQRSGA